MATHPTALTIAGSDPSGGAGLQADLRVFAVHGLWGTGVAAATTVQSATAGVKRSWSTDPEDLACQLEAALEDRPVGGAKTGMLGTAANVRAVGRVLRGRGIPLVIDPVLISSSGAPLLGSGGVEALRDLLAIACVVTPNIAEAAALLGRDLPPDQAARELVALGVEAAVVTGGHGDPGGPCVDHVYLRGPGRGFVMQAPRVRTDHDHGTGCLFAAGIVSALVRGDGLEPAIRHGHACVQAGLRGGARLAAGSVWLERAPG
jgi:hydroxymethylpyrimidine/phosphomethylpyrimidine kinase